MRGWSARRAQHSAYAPQSEWYQFSSSLMEETEESFRNHMNLMNVAYVFLDRSTKACVPCDALLIRRSLV